MSPSPSHADPNQARWRPRRAVPFCAARPASARWDSRPRSGSARRPRLRSPPRAAAPPPRPGRAPRSRRRRPGPWWSICATPRLASLTSSPAPATPSSATPHLVARLTSAARPSLKRGELCHRIARHRRSPRTRWPTAPTSTRSSARTRRGGHAYCQLHPVAGTGGGPELLRVRRRCAVRDPLDNNGDGRADSATSSVPDRDRRSRHVPLQRRADPPWTSPNWNRRQFYHGDAGRHERQARSSGGAGCPPCNIGPLSTPNYPTLARPPVHDRRRHQGVRRPARRGILRRPRRDLRPRRPAADRQPAHQFGLPASARRGASTRPRAQRALIAIQVPITAAAGGARAAASDSGPGHRRVDDREPPEGAASGTPGRRTSSRPVRSRSRGSATRSLTRCWSRCAQRTSGTPAPADDK